MLFIYLLKSWNHKMCKFSFLLTITVVYHQIMIGGNFYIEYSQQ